jgi:hypothetical protein
MEMPGARWYCTKPLIRCNPVLAEDEEEIPRSVDKLDCRVSVRGTDRYDGYVTSTHVLPCGERYERRPGMVETAKGQRSAKSASSLTT